MIPSNRHRSLVPAILPTHYETSPTPCAKNNGRSGKRWKFSASIDNKQAILSESLTFKPAGRRRPFNASEQAHLWRRIPQVDRASLFERVEAPRATLLASGRRGKQIRLQRNKPPSARRIIPAEEPSPRRRQGDAVVNAFLPGPKPASIFSLLVALYGHADRQIPTRRRPTLQRHYVACQRQQPAYPEYNPYHPPLSFHTQPQSNRLSWRGLDRARHSTCRATSTSGWSRLTV